MQDIKLNDSNEKKLIEPIEDGINDCCKNTIKILANYNPMMVCQECKQLIKCFTDHAAYDKYVRFCRSRGRHIQVGEYQYYKVVVFTSYEPFR